MVLLGLILPGTLFDSFSPRVYHFPASASLAVDYLLALYRLPGFFNLSLELACLVLLWQYHQHPQPWLVYLIITLAILAYLAAIVFDHTVGTIDFFEIIEQILFAVMVIVSINVFLKHNPTYYFSFDCGCTCCFA